MGGSWSVAYRTYLNDDPECCRIQHFLTLRMGVVRVIRKSKLPVLRVACAQLRCSGLDQRLAARWRSKSASHPDFNRILWLDDHLFNVDFLHCWLET